MERRPPGDTVPDRATDLDVPTVRRLLAAQGYAVPDGDLHEITVRLNGLVAGLVAYDVYAPFDVEPWTEWPVAGRADEGRDG